MIITKNEHSKVKWINCSIDTGNEKSSQITVPNY